jgi:Tfp pilus assembly protein FimV
VGEDSAGLPSRQRVSVDEAARALRLTVDAVRKRVQRGTIEYEKDQAGRVRIILDSPDNTSTLQDDGPDNTGQADALIAAKDETIEELRAQVRRLERDVDTRNEEIRRRDHLLAAALERIPAIEGPQEASEAAETVEEEPEGAEPQSAEGEAQDELGAERARREVAETTLREGMIEERRRREEAERERDELRRELIGHRGRTEAPEGAEEQQGRGQPQSATGGAQEGARRPWWRRIFRS